MQRHWGRDVDSIIQEMLLLEEVSVFGGSRTPLALDRETHCNQILEHSNFRENAHTHTNRATQLLAPAHKRKCSIKLTVYHC